MRKGEMTIREAIERVLSEVNEPIKVRDLADKVLQIRPSSAKNPRASIYQKLKYDLEGTSIAYLDKNTIVPLRVAAPGVRFRIPLSRREVKRGALAVHPSFDPWITRLDNLESIELVDAHDRPLPTKVVTLYQPSESFFEDLLGDSLAFDLSEWFKSNKARRDDTVLVTIESWEPKRFKLELEPAKERRRHRDEIEAKNKELADLIFDALENSALETLYARSIPSIYLRLSDPKGYPGDHWIEVVERDPRMKLSFGGHITYAEERSLFEEIIFEGKPRITERKFTRREGEQVYRFKAAFKHRKGVWRIIEIQGKQTLAEFDDVLRETFGHDMLDHLSGFWKLVRRGNTRRYRKIDLGSINPLGGGEAADLRIAGLDLKIGDRMEYVYDFGDWIEHEITLEEIKSPEPNVEYPRLVERNRPRYKYCEHCRAKGKRMVATYICIECSQEQGREVMVCEECLEEYHGDHYAEKYVY